MGYGCLDDRCSLSSIEMKVDQQTEFEKKNTALKSFIREKTALVEAGIEAMLTLITHNKSAKSCSKLIYLTTSVSRRRYQNVSFYTSREGSQNLVKHLHPYSKPEIY